MEILFYTSHISWSKIKYNLSDCNLWRCLKADSTGGIPWNIFRLLWNVGLPIKWNVRISAQKAEFQLYFNWISAFLKLKFFFLDRNTDFTLYGQFNIPQKSKNIPWNSARGIRFLGTLTLLYNDPWRLTVSFRVKFCLFKIRVWVIVLKLALSTY